ncbi:hypothetical protein CAMGR0001_2790 [Campylobacter gracilis RM3268]|uniref:Uncharacterized protein n=1 Tax=Campylobacter gracilis RM3268 TaxID=553220 RepID=C8PL00_9BACT|nr:hypothetical protein CAMGR0001_2790 [Campylobacter gracilis RM3268]
MQTAFLNFAAKSAAHADKHTPASAFNFSAEILYTLEHCKDLNAVFPKRLLLHWREAIDMSIALK